MKTFASTIILVLLTSIVGCSDIDNCITESVEGSPFHRQNPAMGAAGINGVVHLDSVLADPGLGNGALSRLLGAMEYSIANIPGSQGSMLYCSLSLNATLSIWQRGSCGWEIHGTSEHVVVVSPGGSAPLVLHYAIHGRTDKTLLRVQLHVGTAALTIHEMSLIRLSEPSGTTAL